MLSRSLVEAYLMFLVFARAAVLDPTVVRSWDDG